MSNIERATNLSGEIEVFGASQQLADKLDLNYAKRGEMAAQLLVATLTETPHVYHDGAQEFSVPVSNRYEGYGENEASTSDTVEIARLALAEFVDAKVPGTKRLHLDGYETQYSSMWRDLKPERRAPRHSVSCFEEAFVEGARAEGIEIMSPEQGMRIIKAAPKRIVGLRLGDRPRFERSYVSTQHDVVTTDGHIVPVYSSQRSYAVRYGMSDLVKERGGRAPGSRIAADIERRVVRLRTRHTER